MNTVFILVALWTTSPETVYTQYVNVFSTNTACERAAQSHREGTVINEGKQKRIFECIPYVGR